MSQAPAHRNDAVDLLDADHINVKKMFDKYKRLCGEDATDDAKKTLAEKICHELTVHTQIEEEIFYPALEGKLKDEKLLREAEIEHDGAKVLIDRITDSSPEDENYDAMIIVLSEYIDHHVKEEREEMFPQARNADVDLKALCAELVMRKEELTGKMIDTL